MYYRVSKQHWKLCDDFWGHSKHANTCETIPYTSSRPDFAHRCDGKRIAHNEYRKSDVHGPYLANNCIQTNAMMSIHILYHRSLTRVDPSMNRPRA